VGDGGYFDARTLSNWTVVRICLPRGQQNIFKPPKFILRQQTGLPWAVAFSGPLLLRQRVEEAGLRRVVVAEDSG
jgi:hypothetical protein